MKLTGFHEGKNLVILAATLTTRIPWFYQPERFTRDQDQDLVMSIKHITAKVGKEPELDRRSPDPAMQLT